jgi:hypothetical protein
MIQIKERLMMPAFVGRSADPSGILDTLGILGILGTSIHGSEGITGWKKKFCWPTEAGEN